MHHVVLSCLAIELNNFHLTNLQSGILLKEAVTRVLGPGISRQCGVGRVASAIEMIALCNRPRKLPNSQLHSTVRVVRDIIRKTGKYLIYLFCLF
jgi:hypothetical protein